MKVKLLHTFFSLFGLTVSLFCCWRFLFVCLFFWNCLPRFQVYSERWGNVNLGRTAQKASRVIKWHKLLIFFFLLKLSGSAGYSSHRGKEETFWSSGWNDRRCLGHIKKTAAWTAAKPHIIQTSFLALWNLCQLLGTWEFTSEDDGTRQ